jgi:COP9 signalosome complex subunit 1
LAIKGLVLENSVFGACIEQELYIRELIEAYMNSNFKTVLELWSRHGIPYVLPSFLETIV